MAHHRDRPARGPPVKPGDREENGQEVSCRLDYGCRPVRLPEYPDKPLWLVVVRGLGAAPMMLLTDLPMRRNRKVLWWVVAAYLTRWRIEEAIRFVKQSYDLEDIRVLTYQRLRNMAVLVNAVAFFTAVVLGTRIKLAIGLFVRYQPVLTIEIEHAKHLNRLVFGAEAHIVDQVCERPNGDALPDRLLYSERMPTWMA